MSTIATTVLTAAIVGCPAINILHDAPYNERTVRTIEQRCSVQTKSPCLKTLKFVNNHYTAMCGQKETEKKPDESTKKDKPFCTNCHTVKPSHGGDSGGETGEDYIYQWSGRQWDYIYGK